MLKVEFPYDIGQEVTIRRSNINGVVRGWYTDRDGKKSAYVEHGTDGILSDYIREEDLDDPLATVPEEG